MEKFPAGLRVRVLDINIQGRECTPKIEVSISGSGKFKGIEVTEMWTYYSVHRNDGSIYGEGKGVIMTRHGNEMPQQQDVL